MAVHSALAALAASVLLHGFTVVSTGAQTGTTLTGTFPGEARPGLVYLPPGFAPTKRYPVVYLLHGMPGSPSEYLYGADLVPFAVRAVTSGAIEPFIAICRPQAPTTHTTANGPARGSAIL